MSPEARPPATAGMIASSGLSSRRTNSKTLDITTQTTTSVITNTRNGGENESEYGDGFRTVEVQTGVIGLEMVRLRRPDGGQFLALLSLAVVFLYNLAVQNLSSLDLLFFSALFLLVIIAAFTEGFLGSPLYPVVGGTLIAVFYLLRFQQTQNAWNLVGIGVGVLFGVYGLVEPLSNSRNESV
ncbi:hypothetical protein ACFQE1_02475 [Halobium palmae]|uniref:Uncharacterized protein n=1 Tax=Halobium palmae TaxID=1776492 RepID=A0ABD5RV89_9EURY